MKNLKDVKFVIYQVLYIFVICVVALKGADINLTEVVAKENVVEKSYADSLKNYLDSLIAMGITPKIIIPKPNEQPENLQVVVAQLQTQLSEFKEIAKVKEVETPVSITPTESYVPITPLVPIQLVQYRENVINNASGEDLILVLDDATEIVVKANSKRTVTLGGQKKVTFKRGGQSVTCVTKTNEQPIINFTRVNGSKKLTELQRTVGYRVTIQDDFIDQLDIKIAGSIRVAQVGNGVYDITLSAFSSEAAFDRYADMSEEPYKTLFTVSVTDKVSHQSITRVGIFEYEEW